MLETKVVEVALDGVRGVIEPSKEERAGAWHLLIDLASLVALSPTESVSGGIAEQIAGWQRFAEQATETLRTGGAATAKGSAGNLSLSVIVLRLLNEVIRPVVTRWEPLVAAHDAGRVRHAPESTALDWEQHWALGPDCRSELSRLRSAVRPYLDTLGKISGRPSLADVTLSGVSSAPMRRSALLSPVAPPAGSTPRAHMVRWLDPRELFRTWRASRAARVPGRDIPLPPRPEPVPPAVEFPSVRGEEFWFDYLADTGDGFDGAAPVAWQVTRGSLELPTDSMHRYPTPPAFVRRGSLLVLGGDLVYPFASSDRYRNQIDLPFRMCAQASTAPTATVAQGAVPPVVLAIPGNHDWLGGIQHFEDVFTTAGDPSEPFAGHWDVVQSRRWWHAKLPQGWWLWGFDTGLDGDLPGEERAYFERAAEQLADGDRVIICTPEPMWRLRQRDHGAHTALRDFVDRLIDLRSARTPLWLSGDSHLFAAYDGPRQARPECHITAGAGGAFLHPTHNLPERVPNEQGPSEFTMSARWPSATDSRSLSPSTLPLRDSQTWFVALTAGLLALVVSGTASLRAGELPWSDDGDGWFPAIRWVLASPATLVVIALLLAIGAVLFRANSHEPDLSNAARVYGVAITAALSAIFVGGAVVRRAVDPPGWIGWVCIPALAGLLTAAAFFGLLSLANRQLHGGDNLVFSRGHSTRFRHFLRFRIGVDGDLTCYAIGIDPAGSGWFDALAKGGVVPPTDPAGSPRVHYVWGRTFRRFEPGPARITLSISHPADKERSRPSGADLAEPPREERDPGAKTVVELFNRLCNELVRRGHFLIHGSGPHYGFTAELRDLDSRRRVLNPNEPVRVLNYVPAYLWRLKFPEVADVVHDDGGMRYLRVDRQRPAAEPIDEGQMRDLLAMRLRTTAESDLRIVVCGKLAPGEPNTRVAPGIIEEAWVSLNAGQPLLIAGGFGGAAQLLADALLNRSDPLELADLATRFRSPLEGSASPDFVTMVRSFRSVAQLRNGLSDGENRELLTTTDPDTVINLVLRSIERVDRRVGSTA